MAIKPSFDTITLAWGKANISDKLSFRDMTVCRPPTASDQEITRLLTILKTRSGLLVGFESFKIWYLMSITHINISTHNYAPIFFSYDNCPGSTHLTTSASCNQLLLTQWQSSLKQTPIIGVFPPFPNKSFSHDWFLFHLHYQICPIFLCNRVLPKNLNSTGNEYRNYIIPKKQTWSHNVSSALVRIVPCFPGCGTFVAGVCADLDEELNYLTKICS